MRDILLENTDNGYDISFENGDFKSTEGLDTSILMSLLIDKRASESEVSEPRRRRGWIGNEQNDQADYQIGSKIWLKEQSRITTQTANECADYAFDSLKWMIDDNLVKNVTVNGRIVDEKIQIEVIFQRFDNQIFSDQYVLWENTGIA